MNVGQLIKQLRLLPKTAQVYTASVDHGEFETDSAVNSIGLCYKHDLDEDDESFQQDISIMPEKWITLRP